MRKEAHAWFAANLKVGDPFYLQTTGGDDGADGLRLLLPGAATTEEREIRNYEVVAVRPDWTDGRGLLGFFNPITLRYQTTPFLRLLLRARDESERAKREGRRPHPFFVLLDEMNLARVEHYFADFLSALESREELHLHDEAAIEGDEVEPGADAESVEVPSRLAIPDNVFFTGTVNVDETTHMFSPKVLDRAFVLEFNDVDLEGYGEAASPGASLELPKFEALEFEEPPDAEDWKELGAIDGGAAIKKWLVDLNGVLASEHRHFGYRVANEIARFVSLLTEQAGDSPETPWIALDLAIHSKILPKLHGTQQELHAMIGRLFHFTVHGADGSTEQPAAWAWAGKGIRRREAEGSIVARLPRSAAKLWRMHRRLETHGFTSFIE
jgi:hypothetical protein